MLRCHKISWHIKRVKSLKARGNVSNGAIIIFVITMRLLSAINKYNDQYCLHQPDVDGIDLMSVG